MQQSSDSALEDFNRTLCNSVDSQLLGLIKDTSTKAATSKVEKLMDISAKAVMDVLNSSPPELSSLAKLFLNRPIPLCLRPHIWSASLQLAKKNVKLVCTSLPTYLLRQLMSVQQCRVRAYHRD